ncbi:MAG: DUF2442 domain-containing protein [Trichlorobacter sp.]|jgi:hypothetical protein|nr:DUF2442 domain-containing protein [Trichlorobacter sp.]
MIKLLNASYCGDYTIFCEFSDGMSGEYDLQHLLMSNETPLTRVLRDLTEFKRFFLSSGALCWPIGLELDPDAIYMELESKGKLMPTRLAA